MQRDEKASAPPKSRTSASQRSSVLDISSCLLPQPRCAARLSGRGGAGRGGAGALESAQTSSSASAPLTLRAQAQHNTSFPGSGSSQSAASAAELVAARALRQGARAALSARPACLRACPTVAYVL